MDPISIGLGVVGLGMSIFGGSSAASEASKQAQLSKQVAAQQSQINDINHTAMLVNSRRQQMENIRNTQRARAMGLNAAVSQGAQFGSGLAGGQAQASAQGNVNALGINQAVQRGNDIYGINQTITGLKAQISDSQSSQATAQGIASIGSSLFGAAGKIGNLSQGFNFGGIFSNTGGDFSGGPAAQNTGGLY